MTEGIAMAAMRLGARVELEEVEEAAAEEIVVEGLWTL